MNIETLYSHLGGLPIPHIRYFDTIGSTNDEALAWTAAGAEDGCLVIADQQTKGRGRFQRRWITHPGAALAFSMILHPTPDEMNQVGFFSPLGALAICQALEEKLGLAAQIKWPNDVILARKKAAGILVEAAWMGDQLQGIVIGIGLNIAAEAVPPANELLFPAISVEEALGPAAKRKPVDREDLLRSILQGIFTWRSRLAEESFHHAWEERLAFREEWVRIEEAGDEESGPISGQITGIDPKGNLLLRNSVGKTVAVVVGDVHLRLID
jgi:BirA family transcriptional regulator, biotin operon repressor / biotin---[acetyl-CoA-carboxylase] ligase